MEVHRDLIERVEIGQISNQSNRAHKVFHYSKLGEYFFVCMPN